MMLDLTNFCSSLVLFFFALKYRMSVITSAMAQEVNYRSQFKNFQEFEGRKASLVEVGALNGICLTIAVLTMTEHIETAGRFGRRYQKIAGRGQGAG